MAHQEIEYGSYEEIIPIPDAGLMGAVGAVSTEHYLITSDGIAQVCEMLMPDGDLAILELGCGCGRCARRFVTEPRVKRYIGIDVMQSVIGWCQREIGARHPKSEFYYADLHSETYNPSGTIKASDYIFPCTDGSIDFACAFSLFTHLKETDARRYLGETQRVLSKKGRALYTIHYDRATAQDPYIGTEDRIDIFVDHWLGMLADAGLESIGRWPRGRDIFGQRYFLIRRR
jgi:SAM-dependent methyltransferase